MKLLSLLLFCSGFTFSQVDTSSSVVGLSFASGIGYVPWYYDFSGGPDAVPMKPEFALAASISYGSWAIIQPTHFEIALQAMYSRTATSTVVLPYGSFALIQEQKTLMIWPRLIVPGNLSPFIEVGLGFGSVRISEEVVTRGYGSTSATSNGPMIGGGSGISLALTPTIRLDGFIQTTFLLGSVSVGPERRRRTFQSPNIITMAFRANYLL